MRFISSTLVLPRLTGLSFIHESLTDKDKLSLMRAADNDISIIQAIYEIARKQGNIDNLTAWMIAMIKKYKNGEVNEPVSVNARSRNRFINFEQRNTDYKKLEQLELEQLKEYAKGLEDKDKDELFV